MKNLLIIVISLSLTSIAFARGERKLNQRVNKRQTKQHNRIKQGARSGSLTRKEGRHLVQGQKRINKFKRKAKSDGDITKKERFKMEKMQNKQSKRIFKAKHNDKSRDGVSTDKNFTGKNHRVSKRQKNQGKRIGEGFKSGELTKGETFGLVQGQKKVLKYKRKAKSDGEFTLKEKVKIEKLQDRQSRRIFKAKHNDHA
jgi:hypothetical protein